MNMMWFYFSLIIAFNQTQSNLSFAFLSDILGTFQNFFLLFSIIKLSPIETSISNLVYVSHLLTLERFWPETLGVETGRGHGKLGAAFPYSPFKAWSPQHVGRREAERGVSYLTGSCGSSPHPLLCFSVTFTTYRHPYVVVVQISDLQRACVGALVGATGPWPSTLPWLRKSTSGLLFPPLPLTIPPSEDDVTSWKLMPRSPLGGKSS